jgi:hypothetical protein
MDESELCEYLMCLLRESLEECRVKSFHDADLLTEDEGVVLKLGKDEYQITIVKSR